MPTSTDLVTDLPADFETFGQAVATSMADLLGGTTGQVLSKASNTNMDFTWVAQDDSNAIQNAIVDAKGDLIAASANDTPARLAVGANGETLVADSSTSTGLRYQGTQNAGKNGVINGGYDIWQRGTSGFTTTFAYNADRWKQAGATAQTVSRQTTSDTTNLPTIQYCARIQRNNASTSTSTLEQLYGFESADSYRFTGQTVTASFYARKGANYSPTSSTLNATLVFGTGTDQSITSGFTGQSTVATTGAVLTTTWQRFTMTGTVSATSTQLGFLFQAFPTGTAGAADYFEVTGVQVELGSVATTFMRNGGTIQGELAACQRYYFQDAAAVLNAQQAVAATTVYGVYYLPVVMRANPTLTQTGAAIAASNTAATTFTADASAASPNKVAWYVTGGASTGQVYLYRPIQVSAEL